MFWYYLVNCVRVVLVCSIIIKSGMQPSDLKANIVPEVVIVVVVVVVVVIVLKVIEIVLREVILEIIIEISSKQPWSTYYMQKNLLMFISLNAQNSCTKLVLPFS